MVLKYILVGCPWKQDVLVIKVLASLTSESGSFFFNFLKKKMSRWGDGKQNILYGKAYVKRKRTNIYYMKKNVIITINFYFTKG